MERIFVCLVFLVLFQSTTAQFGCTVYEDSYVYFENNTNGNLTVNYFTSNRKGWYAIGFSSILGFSAAQQEYIVFYPPNNYSRFSTLEFTVEPVIAQTSQYTVDNVY